MRLASLLVLAAALGASACIPGPSAPAPDPAPTVTVPLPTPDVDAGGDPTELAACVDKFHRLNPDLPLDQVEQLFCSGADASAPSHRPATTNGAR